MYPAASTAMPAPATSPAAERRRKPGRRGPAGSALPCSRRCSNLIITRTGVADLSGDGKVEAR
jgi:hypothetical protein